MVVMQMFIKKIDIIGVNPYVEIPGNVLEQLLKQSGKDKGPIPVKGLINGHSFIQTIVKYQGLWRLYLNTPMREESGTKVGDTVTIALEYDSDPRTIEVPEKFKQALMDNKEATEAFEKLPPYRQKEITRYLANLKTEETLDRNIQKTLDFLSGKETSAVWLDYNRSNEETTG